MLKKGFKFNWFGKFDYRQDQNGNGNNGIICRRIFSLMLDDALIHGQNILSSRTLSGFEYIWIHPAKLLSGFYSFEKKEGEKLREGKGKAKFCAMETCNLRQITNKRINLRLNKFWWRNSPKLKVLFEKNWQLNGKILILVGKIRLITII